MVLNKVSRHFLESLDSNDVYYDQINMQKDDREKKKMTDVRKKTQYSASKFWVEIFSLILYQK